MKDNAKGDTTRTNGVTCVIDDGDVAVFSRTLASQSFLKEAPMPAYDIYVQCTDCGGKHSLLVKIFLVDGPDRSQSIAEWFTGRPVPPQVFALKGHSALCLKTGKKHPLGADDKIFLVPVGPSKAPLGSDF